MFQELLVCLFLLQFALLVRWALLLDDLIQYPDTCCAAVQTRHEVWPVLLEYGLHVWLHELALHVKSI